MNWEPLIPAAILLFFPLFWIGICQIIGSMGGWTRLAGEFPDDDRLHSTKPIRREWFQSGSFGLMNYNSVLQIGVYEEGVRLAVLGLFRAGHPPLFLPWSELKEPRVRRVFPFVRRLEVRVGERPVKALLPVWIEEYLGG